MLGLKGSSLLERGREAAVCAGAARCLAMVLRPMCR